MKYVDEFRHGELAQGVLKAIAAEAVHPTYRFMEFCGGHTHAIARYGLGELLPPPVRMIHGPGCPVCVLPIARIDLAIRLAREHDVILCTYGDTLRVPASGGMSLLKAKAAGSDIRMLYSVTDALRMAREQPQRQVVFLAIGFETTTPPTALAILEAARDGLRNFSVLCNHVLTPPAIAHMLATPEQCARVPLDGVVGPGHVSTVIGSRAYEAFASTFHMPMVIAGFEPLDVLQAILMLMRQVNSGRAEVENEYTRAVTRDGNSKAQALMAEVFELRERFEWRGLGELPRSALRIRERFADFDAEQRFALDSVAVPDNPACECGAILCGLKEPEQCRLFATVCSPENPVGACMVSAEGACAAQFSYRRHIMQERV